MISIVAAVEIPICWVNPDVPGIVLRLDYGCVPFLTKLKYLIWSITYNWTEHAKEINFWAFYFNESCRFLHRRQFVQVRCSLVLVTVTKRASIADFSYIYRVLLMNLRWPRYCMHCLWRTTSPTKCLLVVVCSALVLCCIKRSRFKEILSSVIFTVVTFR